MYVNVCVCIFVCIMYIIRYRDIIRYVYGTVHIWYHMILLGPMIPNAKHEAASNCDWLRAIQFAIKFVVQIASKCFKYILKPIQLLTSSQWSPWGSGLAGPASSHGTAILHRRHFEWRRLRPCAQRSGLSLSGCLRSHLRWSQMISDESNQQQLWPCDWGSTQSLVSSLVTSPSVTSLQAKDSIHSKCVALHFLLRVWGNSGKLQSDVT